MKRGECIVGVERASTAPQELLIGVGKRTRTRARTKTREATLPEVAAAAGGDAARARLYTLCDMLWM